MRVPVTDARRKTEGLPPVTQIVSGMRDTG